MVPNEINPPSAEQDVASKLKIVRMPDFKAIYTNFIQSAYTAFDVTFLFSETAGVNDEGKIVVEAKGRVSMSPLEARMFLHIMQNTIKNYEAQFGPIVIPSGLEATGGNATDGS